MRTLIEELSTEHNPLTLAQDLSTEPDLICLHSALFSCRRVRFSFVAVRPFARLTSMGTRCELTLDGETRVQYGSPWNLLDSLLTQYELLEEPDLPFPLGGAFGYWGYELNRSLSTKLASKAARVPEVPDLCLGFYDSLCVFDHQLGKTWIIATGMQPDGSRSDRQAQHQVRFWKERLAAKPSTPATQGGDLALTPNSVRSNLSQQGFEARVIEAKKRIQAGSIYQINLSHRLEVPMTGCPYAFFQKLVDVSPAPYASYLGFGPIQVASSSPESFLRLSGRQVVTRPIKGTRPRSADPQRDAQLSFELQSSPKELAELVMITDLLRNDLGQICDFGSVVVPDLARLEQYPHVQHLVSTVEGRLRPDQSHVQALAACFPGGSITGTPKLSAMQSIDDLEPIARGPYTGAIGFLGFNQESHLSIGIRTGYKVADTLYFNVGAGIVADSDPTAEYHETMAKAQGFLAALTHQPPALHRSPSSVIPPLSARVQKG